MRNPILVSLIALPLLLASNASAAGARKRAFMVSGTGVLVNSSTIQGGEGPQGSTFLSQFDAIFQWRFLGFGLAFQYDIQGTSQKDFSLGPKFEIRISHLFIDGGYMGYTYKGFTDRSITAQKGNSYYFGVGVRYDLFNKGGKDKGLFFEASYKYRVQTITTQDQTELSQPIIITDTYPLIGLGYKF